MSKIITSFILFLLLVNSITANNKDSLKVEKKNSEPLEFVFRPQLSMGIGMLTFYGDISSNNKGYHPTVSRIGHSLRLINPISEYFELSFYLLFGQVSANERTVDRNLNFNSHITTGGATLNYNFGHLLKRKIINPYIQIGIESIEFLSKVDLKDKYGYTYHYWSDGIIRNIAENDPNAASAIEIYRDYNYESDIREENLDGFGKYQERTFGVPIEIGANLHISDRVKLRVGTAIHFTFSDLIDGVTHESIGNRKGNDKNDKMIFSQIAITYDLTLPKKDEEIQEIEEDPFKYYREDTIDSDLDLIVDHADMCANTPAGLKPVDEFGCLLDGDKDGVPDYLDKELNTPDSVNVNEYGIAYTDEDYELMYRMYKDSTGEFSEHEEEIRKWGSDMNSKINYALKQAAKDTNIKELFVVIGSDLIGVSAEDLHKQLSNENFRIIERGDSVLYVIGGYDNNEIASIIKDLKNDDLNVQGVVEVETNADGEIESISDINEIDTTSIVSNENNEIDTTSIVSNENNEITNENEVSELPVNKDIIYRVQVGAFSNKLSSDVFKELPALVYVKGDDNLYRYFTGVYKDKSDAALHKVKMVTDGYQGSFIVAFQNGERISLAEAGFSITPGFDDKIDDDTVATLSPIDTTLVKFRVQVGAYREKIPTEVLDKFLETGNIYPKRDNISGLTKYYIGEFSSYAEAITYRSELIDQGIIDSFVVGDFKGKIITSGEAIQLLGGR